MVLSHEGICMTMVFGPLIVCHGGIADICNNCCDGIVMVFVVMIFVMVL
jgi:hypothetical protein